MPVWHEDMVGIVGIYEVRVLGGLSTLMLKYLTMMVRMRWTGKLSQVVKVLRNLSIVNAQSTTYALDFKGELRN